ncbi:MAG TPA: sigma-70 family RNA polymerase sigma factor [Polyangiaceae bacterium]|nr:sigma-70 family RNA polymerase sigma factor [Polyangiaceae bacterium]
MEAESALLEKARVGDDAALERLIELYAPRLLRFGRKLCANEHDAEDVVQQTLLSLTHHLAEYRGEGQLSTWLFSIARHHCIKHRTRGAAAVPTEPMERGGLEIAGPSQHSPEAEFSREELDRALEAAILALEPAQREVLVLRDVEGLTAPEVAGALGIGVDAVKSRLHRARKALRARLTPWLEQNTPTPSCPDVIDLLSRYQEGDVTAEVCKTMEAHVDQCPACAARCHSLRSVLSACSAAPVPELPDAFKQAVREQMRRSLKRQIG